MVTDLQTATLVELAADLVEITQTLDRNSGGNARSSLFARRVEIRNELARRDASAPTATAAYVVLADDGDYDSNLNWICGVFATEAGAAAAITELEARYEDERVRAKAYNDKYYKAEAAILRGKINRHEITLDEEIEAFNILCEKTASFDPDFKVQPVPMGELGAWNPHHATDSRVKRGAPLRTVPTSPNQ